MAVGNASQTDKALIPKHGQCTFAEFARRWTRERAVQRIDFGEQTNVLGRVLPQEGPRRRPPTIGNTTGLRELGDQPGELRAREPADLEQVRPDQAAAASILARESQPPQFRGYPTVCV